MWYIITILTHTLIRCVAVRTATPYSHHAQLAATASVKRDGLDAVCKLFCLSDDCVCAADDGLWGAKQTSSAAAAGDAHLHDTIVLRSVRADGRLGEHLAVGVALLPVAAVVLAAEEALGAEHGVVAAGLLRVGGAGERADTCGRARCERAGSGGAMDVCAGGGHD